MTQIRAVACDLFNTLVHIEPELYPTIVWEGKTRFSSATLLLELIEPWYPDLEFDRFVRSSIEVQDELEIERRARNREMDQKK